MRRSLLRVAIFALTFSLGVGVSACWQLYKWSLLPLEVSSDVAVAEHAAQAGISIVGDLRACGSEANYHTMDLSDGTRISVSCKRWFSPEAAHTMEKSLVNAEVAERSQERDEKSRLIGETILTTSPRVMRLRISGNSLCVVNAPSLNHLRLYEAGALHYSKKHGSD